MRIDRLPCRKFSDKDSLHTFIKSEGKELGSAGGAFVYKDYEITGP